MIQRDPNTGTTRPLADPAGFIRHGIGADPAGFIRHGIGAETVRATGPGIDRPGGCITGRSIEDCEAEQQARKAAASVCAQRDLTPVEAAVAQVNFEQNRTFALLDALHDRLATVIDQNDDSSPVEPMPDRGPTKSTVHAQILSMAYSAAAANAHIEAIIRRLSV